MFNQKLFVEFDNFGVVFFGVKFMYIDMYDFFMGFINNF